MKKVFFFLLILCSLSVSAQKQQSLSAHKFTPIIKVSYDQFFDTYGEELKLSPNTTMVPTKTNFQQRGKGSIHRKYKQFYKDVEVYGVAYTLHGDGDLVQYGTGTYLPDINIDMDVPDNDVAVQSKALQYMYAKFSRPFTKLEKHDNWVSEILGKVIIDQKFPAISGDYVLAYRLLLSVPSSQKKYEVIVSARDMEVIFEQSLIKHGHVEGIGKTFYYGNQKIITDSIAPDRYILRDMTRGDGITTYTMSSGTPRLLMDADNVWDDEQANDLVAIDAHWSTSRFYDMMMDSLDYNGLDGEGKSMNPVIYYGGMKNFINAFWDGDKAYFGHGDCHNGPLTTLTVVAHEFTHGVTQYTSNLIYDDESGALNESMSDVFGKALDIYLNKDNFSWDLGPDFALSPFSELFRSFSDPNKVGHPKKYKGLFWEDGAGVHTNSSVMNHWFYLLIEGGKGENEGTFYDVKKMDLTELLKVIFLCQTSYLTPTSGYNDMYEYSLLACETLYGVQSDQYESIKEAWRAVGLPFDRGSGPFVDLALDIENPFDFFCTSSLYIPLSITIENKGNTLIPKTAELYLRSEDSGQYKVELSSDLSPGGSEKMTIENFLQIGEFGFVFENMELYYFEDENSSNNSRIVFYEQLESEMSDFALEDVFIKKKSCFDDTYILDFALRNVSCEFLLPNHNAQVIIMNNGTVVSTLPINISDLIFPGRSISRKEEFTLSGEYESFEVEILSASDSNQDNNFGIVFLDNNPIKDATFNYTFDIDSDFDFATSYNVDYGFWDNEEYLMTTGNQVSTPPCPSISDNFDFGPYSYSTAWAQTCLDLSGFQQTELSFDIRQFRSGRFDYLNDTDLSDKTSVLKVELEQNGSLEEYYYYGLPNGTLQNRKIKLPQGFKGSLRLGFYNNFGFGYFSTSFANRIDAILLDNLKLEELTSLDDVNISPNTLRIIPNPSSDLIILQNVSLVNTNYSITTANGTVIKQGELQGNQMDVSGLTAGYYIIQTITNGQRQIGSFVKM